MILGGGGRYVCLTEIEKKAFARSVATYQEGWDVLISQAVKPHPVQFP